MNRPLDDRTVRGTDAGIGVRAALRSERETSRLVAIVMADIVDSTRQRALHGDRTVDALTAEYESVARTVVEATDGVVVKFLGDGLLAVFATASDAIESAVRLQRAGARLNRRTAVEVRQRIGVTVGEVTLVDGDVRGIVVAEAARLCSAASTGQILVSDTARRTSRRVLPEFASVGELTLKGLPEPVHGWSLEWAHAVPQATVPVRLRPPGPQAMVGRDSEVAMARQIWDRATHDAQVLVITGEPGIGKSRFAFDLAEHVHRSGGLVLAAQCEEFGDSAYQPFAELIAQLCGLDTADQRWTTFFAERADQFGAIVPELGRHPRSTAVSADEAGERHEMMVLGIVEWLEQLSDDTPVLVVLEDVHWAGAELLHVLQSVLKRTSGMRVCFALTTRDHGASDATRRGIDSLHRGPRAAHRLDLTGLSIDATAQLFDERRDVTTTDLIGHLHQSTGGNPLFLLAMADELPPEHHPDRPAAAIVVPDNVKDVFEKQLERLGDETRHVLQHAAVLGQRFELDLATGLCGRSTTEADRAMGEAERYGFVRDCSTPSVLAFEFRHALIAGVLRDQLTSIRRRRAHASAAELLRGSGPALGDRVTRAAQHAVEAGPALPAKVALGLFGEAADAARAAGTFDDARRWVEHALRLAVDGDQRDVVILSARLAHIRFLLNDKSAEAVTEAVSVARRFGDPTLLADAALADDPGLYSQFLGVDERIVANLREALAALPDEDSTHRALLLAALAAQITFGDPHHERFALSEEALGMARRLDDTATLAHVLRHRLTLFSGLGHAGQRMAEARELLGMRPNTGDESNDISLLRAISHAHLQAGDADSGREAMDRVRAAAGRCPVTHAQRGSILMWEAGWALLDGDLAAAERASKAAFKVGSNHVSTQSTMATARQLLTIRSWQDRTASMIESVRQGAELVPMLAPHLAYWMLQIDRADEAQRAWANWDDEATMPAMLIGGAGESIVVEAALVCASVDSAERCRFYFDLLLPHADALTNPVCPERSTHLVLGLLAARMGDHDSADRHFVAAIDHAYRLKAPLLSAEASIRRARYHLDHLDASANPQEVARHAMETGERLGAARLVRLGRELLNDSQRLPRSP